MISVLTNTKRMFIIVDIFVNVSEFVYIVRFNIVKKEKEKIVVKRDEKEKNN